MRVVIQRVLRSSVSINNIKKCSIVKGLVIFVGIETKDDKQDSIWLASKISQLRIFADKNGVMNKSIIDIDGEIIVISQFTLHAKIKKGNRPSYINAAKKNQASNLYGQFKDDLSYFTSKKVYSGDFGADMQVSLVNDGPVTIVIDTKNRQ